MYSINLNIVSMNICKNDLFIEEFSFSFTYCKFCVIILKLLANTIWRLINTYTSFYFYILMVSNDKILDFWIFINKKSHLEKIV